MSTPPQPPGPGEDGAALAERLGWDGLAILRVAQQALDAANFHDEADQVGAMAGQLTARATGAGVTAGARPEPVVIHVDAARRQLHVRLSVYTGRDAEHLKINGILSCSPDEADAIVGRLDPGGWTEGK